MTAYAETTELQRIIDDMFDAQTIAYGDSSGVLQFLTVAGGSLFGRDASLDEIVNVTMAANDVVATSDATGAFITPNIGDNQAVGRLSGDVQGLTAANLRTILDILTARKTADEVISNDATLNNDGDLVVSLSANTNYYVTAHMRVQGNTTADWKWAWTIPSGATIYLDAAYGQSASGTNDRHYVYVSTSGGSQGAAIFTNNQNHGIQFQGVVEVAGTAGNLQFQWSQNTAHLSNLTLFENSGILAIGF